MIYVFFAVPLLLSVAANVVQWLENRRLWRRLAEETDWMGPVGCFTRELIIPDDWEAGR